MQIIIRNAVRCNHCGDMIDSNYTHDFKACNCGKVAVDGGHDYLRRCAASKDDYTELSETAEVADYAKAADELARAQTALDMVNTTVEFEV